MKKRCEAVTQPSTYSAAHRCLKRPVPKKTGKRHLCVHHQNMETVRRP